MSTTHQPKEDRHDVKHKEHKEERVAGMHFHDRPSDTVRPPATECRLRGSIYGSAPTSVHPICPDSCVRIIARVYSNAMQRLAKEDRTGH